ncbi:MAG: NAD(P)H-dependent oxidoreductase, partial [Oscillospiraceae bacterium]|nr:NAD(P)H-dependent oxidoreductase [Oscillospiraceae bacterium]
MNILVLNGSPKGQNSVTLQTVLYLEALHPEHEFTYLHAGARIKALEKDFSPAREALEKADLLLFAYPVYTFIAPSQLHRFIELVKESGMELAGKCATQITTSKHFYDVTAHQYVQDNCGDLGLNYVRGLSADMDDLLSEKGRKEAEKFFDFVAWSCEKGYFEPVAEAGKSGERMPASVPAAKETEKNGQVAIVTDCGEEDTALASMIARFRAVAPFETKVVNLREYPFRGGCLGCFNCAVTGKCVYTDGFDSFLREEIQTAQAIVYAFTVRDHSMGA